MRQHSVLCLTVAKEQDMVSIACHCSVTSGASAGRSQSYRGKSSECSSPPEWCLLSAEPWAGAAKPAPAHSCMWPGLPHSMGPGSKGGHPKARTRRDLYISGAGLRICRIVTLLYLPNYGSQAPNHPFLIKKSRWHWMTHGDSCLWRLWEATLP